ncbi:MAG: hypothetical protein KJ630_23085, partial [Proteobacteria bacterium]|nr:hypothetical protein [Pseudomonadota bacterium]
RNDFFLPVDQNALQGVLPDISWHHLDPHQENWSPESHGLAFLLRAPKHSDGGSDFFVMLNGDRRQTLQFEPPAPSGKGTYWHRIIDTAADSPRDFMSIEETLQQPESARFDLPPFACIVLQSVS